jgi:hypothetical protein
MEPTRNSAISSDPSEAGIRSWMGGISGDAAVVSIDWHGPRSGGSPDVGGPQVVVIYVLESMGLPPKAPLLEHGQRDDTASLAEGDSPYRAPVCQSTRC